MENTRLEILKDGEYIPLKLQDNDAIRYNKVINKIGKVDSREISHSNTFSIPWVHENISALGLNLFNVNFLAASLNTKYKAKYYKQESLQQVGFVIINNMNDGTINLNFIDEALSLTERWASTSYKSLLLDSSSIFTTEETAALDQMKGYSMTKVSVLSHLSNIGGQVYPIALFPNNLNVIGDKWQTYLNSERLDDSINPYQARPVFNAMAFINLACSSYGYTPILHPSIDWDIMEKTYMVGSDLNKNASESGGIVSTSYPTVLEANSMVYKYNSFTQFYIHKIAMLYPSEVGIIPDSIPNFPSQPPGMFPDGTYVNVSGRPFFTQRTIFVPNVAAGNVGTIRFFAQNSFSSTDLKTVHGVWNTINGGVDKIINNLTFTLGSQDSSNVYDVIVDKVQLDTVPAGATSLIGIYIVRSNGSSLGTYTMGNMTVTETFLPTSVGVSYDKSDQFLQDNVDLTLLAPNESVSKLLTGLMHKEGILMNVDSFSKEVEFFAYSAYKTRRDAGEYEDWTKYLQEYVSPEFNTDYGNEYAIKNEIGLADPYLGNTNRIILGNQTSNSKYKEFTENYLSDFSDVKAIELIPNTLVPYTEYTCDGLSLVELDGTLGNLAQRRFDTTTQGTLTNLPALVNVNLLNIPSGVSDWYELIDLSVRCTPTFLLPIQVVKNLDLRLPIFIGQIGGFYIIEEVQEYIDSSTPVKVKMIKLPNT